jgi:hypothetical protein
MTPDSNFSILLDDEFTFLESESSQDVEHHIQGRKFRCHLNNAVENPVY